MPGATPLVFAGDFTEASGFAAGCQVVAMESRPAAVFAANDMMAIGCLAALGEAGLELPREIAIAGFDDIPLAAFVRPALTTMRVHIAELGHEAMRRLAATIDGSGLDTPQSQLLQPEPVVRESCGATHLARAVPSHRRAVSHGGHDGHHPLVEQPSAPEPPVEKPRKRRTPS
jgi:LacI family transcriptional regulator